MEQLDRPIYDYCHVEFNNNNRIDLWILLAGMLICNFTFIDEFRSVENLRKPLNEIKTSHSIIEVTKLQERFSHIFSSYSFEIYRDNLTINNNEKSFMIEDSASGYHELLDILKPFTKR
jgi:hypothetical protein